MLSEAGGLECEIALDNRCSWGFLAGKSLGLVAILDCIYLSVMIYSIPGA